MTERLQDGRGLCELLLELQPHITRILTVPHQSARADVAEALKDLQAYNRYFFEATGNPQPTVDALAWRMLALETIEVGAGTRVHRPNVDAELVQISGRLASPWGGPSAPENKLTGMGLAHFAAFYKRSWRANDWIFGRLDGIDRVLRIALNPDRLQRLYGQRQVQVPGSTQVTSAADYVFECVKALAVDSAPPTMHPQLLTAWERALPDIRKELAWLDCPATVPPPLLEYCAAALTRRLHLEVLLCELPKLAEAIDQDEAIGADASAAAQRLRARIGLQGQSGQLNAATAIDLLTEGLLGEDTLNGEIGSDHFTRIVSQGVAVSHATASTATGKMKALKVLFKLTEWPIQAFYWIANRLSRSSSTNAALEGAMVGIGAALIAAAMLAEKLPSALTAIGWGLLAGGLFASLLRDRRIGLVALIVSAALIASINPPAALAAIIFGGALLIVLRFSGAFGAVMLIGLAAWWSAGSPTFESARALVCVDRLKWLALCANHPDAKLLADAERLLEVGVPALLVVLIVLSTNWSRLARNWWHRRKS